MRRAQPRLLCAGSAWVERVHRASILMRDSVLLVELLHNPQRNFQGIQFIIDRHFPWSSIFNTVEKMLDFQFQRVVLVYENSLDQGFLFVAEGILGQHVVRRRLSMDVYFLIRIIQNDIISCVQVGGSTLQECLNNSFESFCIRNTVE